MPHAMTASVAKKKIAASTDITNTIAVVTSVSLRDGHETLWASWRTCRANSPGLVFGVAGGVMPSFLSVVLRFDCYLAGVEGLEPPAPGFGDRCSTN